MIDVTKAVFISPLRSEEELCLLEIDQSGSLGEWVEMLSRVAVRLGELELTYNPATTTRYFFEVNWEQKMRGRY
jgi:hypothetical protein